MASPAGDPQHWRVEIKRGNAAEPYRITQAQAFHTEFAARLFGRMATVQACEESRDLYNYWSIAQAA